MRRLALLILAVTCIADARSFHLTVSNAAPITPNSFPGLTRWHKANDTTTVNGGTVANGDPVSAFAGKLGTEPTFAATTTARPTWTASAVNGKAALTFNGSTNRMSDGAAPAFNYDANFTVCIVHRVTTLSGFPTLITTASATLSKTIEFAYTSNATFKEMYFGDSSGSHASKIDGQLGTVTNVWRTVCITNNAGTTTWYNNGSTVTKSALSAAGGSPGTGNFLGSWISAADFYAGDIAELDVWGATALSGADIASLHTNYFLTEYGF